MKTQASHRISTDEPDYALSLAANPEFDTTTVRFNYQSMVTPSSVYDYDMTTRQRTLLKRTEVLGGYDAGELRVAAHLGRGARRHEGADLARLSQGHEARRLGADAAVCLRLVRHLAVADVLLEPPEPARSRRGLRAGLHPRRRRARRGVARTGTHDAEDEHLHRLHRLRRPPDQEQVHVGGPPGHPGRQRRRSADGRGRQHASGSVQGGRRPGAVRRRDQHDARRVAAADDERVHRVGQPEQQARLRLHDEVLALRQRQGAALSVDAGARVAERQPGAVLGGREAGGQAAGRRRPTRTRCC